MEYTSYLSNAQGATTDFSSGTSISDIYHQARASYGHGWTIHIIDSDGVEVLTRTLRD